MSSKRIIIIVAVVLVLGLAAFLLLSNDDDSSGDQANANNGTQQADSEGQQTADSNFSPVGMMDMAFEATVDGTDADGKSYQMLLQYDGEGRTRMSGEQNGTRFETVFTSDAFYSCEGENCVKFPISQSDNSPFTPGEYVYEDEDFTDFKNSATYKGTGDCPAGTCDIWEVTEDGYTSQLYLDSNQRISKVEGSSAEGSVSITYVYKNVNIEIPQNAQTIPTLEQ